MAGGSACGPLSARHMAILGQEATRERSLNSVQVTNERRLCPLPAVPWTSHSYQKR